MTGFYRGGTALLSLLMLLLGAILLVEGLVTLRPVGILLGALFLAAGGGRFYLLRRR